MKKIGILNQDISNLVASMGHMDKITICDAGLPIPEYLWRIDLAVVPGLPPFLDICEAVAGELQVQQIIMADELQEKNPDLVDKVKRIFPSAETTFVPHVTFKNLSTESRAIIRTGECTPYANVILVSGVTF